MNSFESPANQPKAMTDLVRIAEPTKETVERSKTVADNGIDVAADQVGGTPTDGRIGSMATIAAIRYAVFVVEQGVDVAIEWDDKETIAEHILLINNKQPVGTARVRPVDGKALKCERIAVRPEDRGAGWGEQLMQVCESIAHEHGVTECILHAQQRVADFYRRQGYVVIGDPFEEAGIPHVKMRLELSS